MSTSLRSGVPLMKALRRSSNRPAVQRANESLLESLKAGEDFAGALQDHQHLFPPLFVGMASVAARTGHLPEILRELEQYYRFQLTLRRRFLRQISWPAFQLAMAIATIALVIYLLGILPAADVLGLGLRGATGAMIWIGAWMLLGAAIVGAYWMVRNQLGQAQRVDAFFMSIPVLGPTLRTLALARLTMAMSLTLDSGISARKAIPLALRASGNGVFRELARPLGSSLRKGDAISEAFGRHSEFPDELIDIIANAEEAGTLPESMRRQSEEYSERAEHQLQLVNQAAGWIVWLIVAAIIVFFIFRIAMTAYIGPINEMLDTLPGGRVR